MDINQWTQFARFLGRNVRVHKIIFFSITILTNLFKNFK